MILAIDLKKHEVQIRERRLGSITGFYGTAGEIADCAQCRGAHNRRRCFTQNNACMSGCAQGTLSAVTDAAVVNHAPVGCAADAMGANNARKWGEFAQSMPHRDLMIYSTNMDENDTVFGATEKLRRTVRSVFAERRPAAVFITTSCTSAIIGEDIAPVAKKLSEELGIPVVPVACEGFRSRIWATGFDAAHHAILTGIVKPPVRKRPVVNVINFRASYKKQIAETFAALGVTPFFVTGYCTVEELSHLSESAASISICGTLGTYLGNGLEQAYGVPYVKSIQPHGMEGYDAWLRALGKVLGKEKTAEAIIEKERARFLPQIEMLREKLQGKRAVVGMGPSFTFNFARVLGELGMRVVWSAAWHLDQVYDHGALPESLALLAQRDPDMPVSVAEYQYQEIIKLLMRLKPDLYLYRHPTNASWVMKLGIPAVSLIDEYMGFGYEGLVRFGQTVADVLENRNFERRLKEHTRLPYTRWWLEQEQQALLTGEAAQ